MIFMKKLTTRLLSLVLLGAFIPSFVLADSWYLENGDITIKATSDTSQTVTQGENSKEDSNPTISNWDPNGNNAGNTGSTDHTITIEAADANRKFVYLSVDGGKAFSLKNGDKVRVRQSKFTTKLVRLSKKSFCEILDSKMGMEAAKHEK